MRIEQLTEVAKEYNINRPRKLVGSEVECEIDGTLSSGFITAIKPVKPELNQDKVAMTPEGIIATYESQPPMVPSHMFYRVDYPSR